MFKCVCIYINFIFKNKSGVLLYFEIIVEYWIKGEYIYKEMQDVYIKIMI